jgi:hypothetical protein
MTAYHDRLTNGNYTTADTDTSSGSDTTNEHHELTVADLKDQLAARGLPTSGTKNELIARLATPTTDDQ